MFQVWAASIAIAIASLLVLYGIVDSSGSAGLWSVGGGLAICQFVIAMAVLVESAISIHRGRDGIVMGWARRFRF